MPRDEQDLRQTDDRDERGVLLQRDEVVEQRRQDPAHRLRDHDVAQRLPLRQPERACGRGLAPVDALEARIGRPRRRTRRTRARARAMPSQNSCVLPRHVRSERLDAGEREPEPDQVDDDDRRDAAEHVGVDDRERAQREERASGKLPHDRDDERPDQHEDFGDDEQLDVPPEPANQRGATRPDQVPLEHARPGRDRALAARKNAPNATIAATSPKPITYSRSSRASSAAMRASRMRSVGARGDGLAGSGRSPARRTRGRSAPRFRARSRSPARLPDRGRRSRATGRTRAGRPTSTAVERDRDDLGDDGPRRRRA